MTNLIAVRDDDLSQEAGRVVYWSLTSEIPLIPLHEAIGHLGLTGPAARTASEVFATVVKSFEEKHLLARPLGKKAGFAMVREFEHLLSRPQLGFETVCTVYLETDPHGWPVVMSNPTAHPLRDDIQEKLTSQLEVIPGHRVGSWLVQLAEGQLNGVSLRPSGGFYFIPKASVPTWIALSAAIAPLGVTTFQIPAVTSDDAVRAVSAAIEREAQDVLDQVALDIENDHLGSRALTNREGSLINVEKKLTMYEGLLGTSLQSLRDRLEQVQGNLAAAALTRLVADDDVAA